MASDLSTALLRPTRVTPPCTPGPSGLSTLAVALVGIGALYVASRRLAGQRRDGRLRGTSYHLAGYRPVDHPQGLADEGLRRPRRRSARAFEEAGVKGKVHKHPLGAFTYEKRFEAYVRPIRVMVYLSEVKNEKVVGGNKTNAGESG